MLIGAPPRSSNDARPAWGVDCDADLVCRGVTDETHDVRSFHFAAEQPCTFRFDAGQFITLELPHGPEPVFRCYTISSPPTRPETISITSKRVPGGPVSNWLHDTVRPGTRLRATGPSGSFTLPHGPAPLLLLSAGSGVTPLMSMARTLADRAEDRDVLFVHSARTPSDIVFRDELPLLARRMPRFRVAHVVERTGAEPGWPGLVGRLDASMLALLAPDLGQRDVYCCGPAPYMAAVRALLDGAGFDRSRYHEESFNFDELPGAVQADVEQEAEAVAGFTVTFAKSGASVVCPPGMSVLAAAKQAGLRLPQSCTRGVCGTCKSRMLSGRVDMKHGGGIRPREVEQGMVLLCCSQPLQDLVIDR